MASPLSLCSSHQPTNAPLSQFLLPLWSGRESYTPPPCNMMIHDWEPPSFPLLRSAPHCNAPKPAQHPDTANNPKGRGARPHRCSPDTQPPIRPERLTPGRCFKDTPVRVHPASISVLWKDFADLLAQSYALRPKYLPVPPKVVAGAPQAGPTVSVSPRLPPIPQSSAVHPLTRAKCYVLSRPP